LSTGDEIWVEAYVPTEQRSAVQSGDAVELWVDSAGRQRLAGRVQGVLPVLKPLPAGEGAASALGAPSAQFYAVVLIGFDDPVTAKGVVWPGQRISAIFRPIEPARP